MLRITIICVLLTTGIAIAQTKPSRPQFDAESVKLNKSGAAEADGGILPGGEFSVTNMSMIEIMQFAYKVDGSAISSFPSWFRSDRFDIIAKGPVNTTGPTLQLMLQSLLATEFKLVVHTEQKPQEAFALVVGKDGPKLRKAANPAPVPGPEKPQFEDAVDHCKRTNDSGQVIADCTNITMRELAKRLPSLAPAYLDRPVVDLTGLAGPWDLKLQWTGKGKIDTEGGLTVFDALTKIGLRLEQRKVPLPGLVIDHIERLKEN